jgi:hypothetical protein
MARHQRFGSFIFVGALSLVAFACSSSPSGPSTNGSFNVSGRVLDFQTNNGISGATVVFADPSSTTVIVEKAHAITDGDNATEYADQVRAGFGSTLDNGMRRIAEALVSAERSMQRRDDR